MGWWKDELPYGTSKRRLYGMAIGSLVIVPLIVLLAFTTLSDASDKQRGKIAEAVTTTTAPANAPFDPSKITNIPTTQLVTTTTSTAVPYTPKSLPQSPEGSVLTPEDIKRIYTVEQSGLQPSVFEAAKEVAIALLKARATGEGADRFSLFLNSEPGIVRVEALEIDGAYAEVSSDPAYIRTVVWWNAKTYYGGTPILQARTATYLEPGTLFPVNTDQLPLELSSDPYLKTRFAN